jgi:hypothetical protein
MPFRTTGRLGHSARKIQRAYRAYRARKSKAINRGGRKGKIRGLFTAPRAGGRQLAIPMKCGYQYTLVGTGASSVPLDQDISLQYMLNPSWFTRYAPIFQWIKINKVRVEITCPSNIGQFGVAGSSLYRVWSKKAGSVAETPPTNNNEWMNIQNCRRSVFSGKTNSVNYYFTPLMEAPQGATIAKRLMGPRFWEFPSGPTQCIPHIGIIAHIVKMDGSVITNSETFNVNVTLYCQFKGVKQL